MNSKLIPKQKITKSSTKLKRHLPVSPSPYSAIESVSLSGPTLGSLLIDARP